MTSSFRISRTSAALLVMAAVAAHLEQARQIRAGLTRGGVDTTDAA